MLGLFDICRLRQLLLPLREWELRPTLHITTPRLHQQKPPETQLNFLVHPHRFTSSITAIGTITIHILIGEEEGLIADLLLVAVGAEVEVLVEDEAVAVHLGDPSRRGGGG